MKKHFPDQRTSPRGEGAPVAAFRQHSPLAFFTSFSGSNSQNAEERPGASERSTSVAEIPSPRGEGALVAAFRQHSPPAFFTSFSGSNSQNAEERQGASERSTSVAEIPSPRGGLG